MGEPLDLLAEAITVEALHGLRDPGVEVTAPGVEKAPVATSWVSACLKVYSRSGKRRVS